VGPSVHMEVIGAGGCRGRPWRLNMRFPCNADRDRLSSAETRHATGRHVVSGASKSKE
jgi:hypothetical protein